MKYFYIITFLIKHDLTFLKECWEIEFLKNKKFKWNKLLAKMFREKNTYIVWWRLASEMGFHGNKKQKAVAKKIHKKITIKYNIDIGFGAKIGKGFVIDHYVGVVIIALVKIGENFSIRQNTTIGNGCVEIGDNVYIGANSCIISNKGISPDNPLRIGSNVTIGAMSFINKDIPDNCVVYTEKSNKIIINHI